MLRLDAPFVTALALYIHVTSGYNGRMSIIVGARDLKNRLGGYLRLARGGTRVIITERGRPVAELRALELADTELERRLQQLAAEGLVTLRSGESLPQPIRLRIAGDAMLSEAIIQDREDRL